MAVGAFLYSQKYYRLYSCWLFYFVLENFLFRFDLKVALLFRQWLSSWSIFCCRRLLQTKAWRQCRLFFRQAPARCKSQPRHFSFSSGFCATLVGHISLLFLCDGHMFSYFKRINGAKLVFFFFLFFFLNRHLVYERQVAWSFLLFINEFFLFWLFPHFFVVVVFSVRREKQVSEKSSRVYGLLSRLFCSVGNLRLAERWMAMEKRREKRGKMKYKKVKRFLCGTLLRCFTDKYYDVLPAATLGAFPPAPWKQNNQHFLAPTFFW